MKSKCLSLFLCSFLVLLSCNNEKKKKETIVAQEENATKESENSEMSIGQMAPKTIDAFEAKFGKHEGQRRNHISGFCFSGYIRLKDKSISKYSKSPLFNGKALKVIGRFSHKDGVKKDESDPGEYGMAFEVQFQEGGTHNFSMNTLDFFPVKSPEGFLQLMQAKVSGKKEDLEQVKKDHPEIKAFKAHYAKKPKVLKSYANHQFNSVNTFYLDNEEGERTPARWSFVPKNPERQPDTSKEIDFYKETLSALEESGSLKWDMVVTIANENDPINDASAVWIGEHKQVVAAVLTVDGIQIEGECEDKNFDPLVLQKGISPSEDPILKFRSPTYAIAFGRRLQEKHSEK